MKDESSLYSWIAGLTLIVGLAMIFILGYNYADNMMEDMKVNPPGDTYANDFWFQNLAYWYTIGWVLLVLLLIYVPVQGIILFKVFGKYITRAFNRRREKQHLDCGRR